MKTYKLKNYFGKLILLFIVTITLSNCQAEEDFSENNAPASIAYKEEIKRYLIELKLSTNKKKLDKIENLSNAIKPNSLKIYDLNSTQKVLIVDVSNLKGLETSFVTKALFFLDKDKIIRSRLITINGTNIVMDKNELILSVLNTAKDKKHYNGIVSFYNPFQEILQKNVYQNGKLVESQVLGSSSNTPNSKNNGCVAWYWVTTYASGQQTWSYMYTSCNCEENTYRTSCGGSDGGGGGSGVGPEFPSNPEENKEVDYFSPEGEHIRYQFKNNVWRIVLMSLPEVVVKAKSSTYPYLIFNWPQDQRKVYNEGMVFTFESETNTWNGVLATDAIIAQTIEDNIDDSELDPCSKAVMDKLKLSTENDISKMINRFNPATSVFNIKMSTGKVRNTVNWAETTKTASSAADVNMVFNEDYIKGTLYGTRPTDLSVATTMAHEIIHAYLISLLEDHLKNSSVGINDFPTIFDAYVQQQASKNTSILPDAHHELIAGKYVNAIASAIEQFHLGDTFHSGYPRQVYLDMAWGGLKETKIFNKTYPQGSTDRERILDRINTEMKGTLYQGYTPLGTPCKN